MTGSLWEMIILTMKIWSYLTPTRPYSKCRPRKMAEHKIDISITQLLMVLYIHLVCTNSWMPLLPNDLGHNIFAVTLWNIFKHIVMALTRQIRAFLTFVLVFMTNNDSKLKCRGYETFPWVFSHSHLWKIEKCPKQNESTFDVVAFNHNASCLTLSLFMKICTSISNCFIFNVNSYSSRSKVVGNVTATILWPKWLWRISSHLEFLDTYWRVSYCKWFSPTYYIQKPIFDARNCESMKLEAELWKFPFAFCHFPRPTFSKRPWKTQILVQFALLKL